MAKEFDLQAAKSGAPVQTRDDHSVRILAYDLKGNYCIAAAVLCNDGTEIVEEYNEKCQINNIIQSALDLFMAPVMRKVWRVTAELDCQEDAQSASFMLAERYLDLKPTIEQIEIED